MKRFIAFCSDWYDLILSVIFHFVLLYLFISAVVSSSDGWIVPVFGMTHWLAGVSFCYHVVPSIKRLKTRRT